MLKLSKAIKVVGRFLCKLGLHDWGMWHPIREGYEQNYRRTGRKVKYCYRCGLRKEGKDG